MRLVPALLFTLGVACVGDIAKPVPRAVDPSTEVTPEVAKPKGFTLPSDQPIQLLPFAVRFARLQAVTGAGPSDPMFSKLLESRTSLGDYDFAAGIKPDSSWTALRITQWVTAVKPICASAQMQQRYPDFPASLAPLIETAYGRAATSDDVSAVNDALSGLTLSTEERRDGVCVAILSSMEFVAL